ncbi:MAG: hypothetical protein J0M19_05260 [Sphingomonadales bacterium]|nr:hypothetical protein [Sphingomonadales bacterium]
MTIARQQVALAAELRCERVICIARGLSPDILELQHLVEAGGAQFHLIGQARALLGMVSAVDEIFVLADGLFASTAVAAALLDEGQAVLVQPIDQGLAAGFERIDANWASAGAMRLPGRLMERLAELPGDCDAGSALLRIALQAGIRQRPIPQSGNEGLFWSIVRSEDDAHNLEPHWIRQRTQDDGAPSAARGVALVAVRKFGPALLHAGSGARAVGIAAALAALLAIGAGWLRFPAVGLGFVAIGWILRETAVLLARIESDMGRGPAGLARKELYGWLLDGIIVVLAAWGTEMHPGQHFIDRLFPSFMLIALLRIVPRLLAPRWTGWFADRAVLAIFLTVAIGGGVGSAAIHIAAVLAAIIGIVIPSDNRG